MPIVRLQSAGSQVVAKAGVNFYGDSGTIAVNTAAFVPVAGLAVPGLPNLTWIVLQTAGAGSCTVQPQIAVRRGQLDPATLQTAPDWVAIGPPALVPPLGSTVFEFNAPVEFMRLQITTPVLTTAVCQVLLLASG
jgi:hypothetical protein